MERKILVLTAFLAVALVTTTASAWDMRWMNAPTAPLYGPDGATPIPAGSLVQLIQDGGNNQIDDPLDTLGSGAALDNWIAAGTPPVGDDILVASTDAANPQFAYLPGYFAAVYIQSALPAGTKLYTRFFTAARPERCDWYGTIGPDLVAGQDPNGTFYILPNSPFPDYTIMQSATADTHIPEPATLLIGGVGLLLAFVRRRK